MLLASSCQSDPSILEQALDPGTAVPTEEPPPTALSSPTPSEDSTQGPVPTEAPTPAKRPNPTEAPAPTDGPVPIDGPSPTEVSGPTGGFGGSVHYVPSVVAPLPEGSRLEGQPFAPSGAMPSAIIASTEDCDIVTIGSQSSELVVLWDYSTSDYRSLDCSDQGSEYRENTGMAEIAAGYIDDVEWSDPKYVLLSMCCEPGVGRFEVLDIEEDDLPIWMALNGYSPWIDSLGTFLFSASGVGDAIVSFGTVPFQVSYDDSSEPSHPYYRLLGDVLYKHLVLEEGSASTLRWSVGQSTWVGGDDIVVRIMTILSDRGWYPWVAKISLEGGATVSNARGSGWMLPRGDRLGNLVVAEQTCVPIPYLAGCVGLSARVVVVDSQTLTPLYEVEVDDTIVDMDLVRGWLLVTLVDGRMGTLDLSDGTFTVLANGIRNAVWRE